VCKFNSHAMKGTNKNCNVNREKLLYSLCPHMFKKVALMVSLSHAQNTPSTHKFYLVV